MNVRRKVRDYLRAGSKEVWLLDHANREVLVHTSTGIRVLLETDALESPLLAGFSAIVADLVVNLYRRLHRSGSHVPEFADKSPSGPGSRTKC